MSTLKLADYQDKYKHIKFRREDGILEMTLHTKGGSLRWGRKAHGELVDAFLDIGRDREKRQPDRNQQNAQKPEGRIAALRRDRVSRYAQRQQ